MLVRSHGVWRPARVHSPVPGPAERPRPRQVAPGLRFGARWAGLGLNLAAWRLGAVVTAVGWRRSPRAAEIEIEATNGVAVTGSSTATPADDGAPPGRARPGEEPRRGHPFVPRPSARPPRAVPRPPPLGELAGATDVVDRTGRLAGDDGMAWDVYLKRPGRPRVRVAWPEDLPETRHRSGAPGGRGRAEPLR